MNTLETIRDHISTLKPELENMKAIVAEVKRLGKY